MGGAKWEARIPLFLMIVTSVLRCRFGHCHTFVSGERGAKMGVAHIVCWGGVCEVGLQKAKHGVAYLIFQHPGLTSWTWVTACGWAFDDGGGDEQRGMCDRWHLNWVWYHHAVELQAWVSHFLMCDTFCVSVSIFGSCVVLLLLGSVPFYVYPRDDHEVLKPSL